jgi:uncharacterized phiE125 gp8 family phage protein
VLRFNSIWPQTVLRAAKGIEIQFVAGFGDASAVPDDIKMALKLIVANLYENRGCCDPNDLPSSAHAILQPYRILRV